MGYLRDLHKFYYYTGTCSLRFTQAGTIFVLGFFCFLVERSVCKMEVKKFLWELASPKQQVVSSARKEPLTTTVIPTAWEPRYSKLYPVHSS